MINHFREAYRERPALRHWVILLVAVSWLISSVSCSLARRLEPWVLAQEPRQEAGRLVLATRTPWPTFTPVPAPSPTPTLTPSPLPAPTETAMPTVTPISSVDVAASGTLGTAFVANPEAVVTAIMAEAPQPTTPFMPTPPPPPPPPATATPMPASTPTPSHAYQMVEVYEDHTSNWFLTGYIAIVNSQEIPIGGIKAVGIFEPGGLRHESPLSQWFFDGKTAPGAVVKTSSVKFEPPGGIEAGTWTIHLEDEWGTRLSGDVAIRTDPSQPEWFFIKFKQPGPPPPLRAPATRITTPAPRGTWSPPTPSLPTVTPRPNPYPTPSGDVRV